MSEKEEIRIKKEAIKNRYSMMKKPTVLKFLSSSYDNGRVPNNIFALIDNYDLFQTSVEDVFNYFGISTKEELLSLLMDPNRQEDFYHFKNREPIGKAANYDKQSSDDMDLYCDSASEESNANDDFHLSM